MAGHDAKITIESTGETDSIQLTDAYVDLLYPGNPQQTVAAIREELKAKFEDKARRAVGTIVVSWISENIQVST